jgi:diketogulonate reductase-like aldo/keto reductase
VQIGARLGHSEHVSENLQSLSFELDAADQAVLDSVLSEGKMLPGDCGDEYRG